ncbi:MAG: hypothetical protein ACI32N_08615 [Bulleidia sp.]
MEQNNTVYEYMQVQATQQDIDAYLTCYACFGWEKSEVTKLYENPLTVTIMFRRDRRLINRMELTRLQKNFEACALEIETLEQSIVSNATMYALTVAMAGVACGAVALYSLIHHILIGMIMFVPFLFCVIQPYFIYRRTIREKRKELQPVIDGKKEEIRTICDRGSALI